MLMFWQCLRKRLQTIPLPRFQPLRLCRKRILRRKRFENVFLRDIPLPILLGNFILGVVLWNLSNRWEKIKQNDNPAAVVRFGMRDRGHQLQCVFAPYTYRSSAVEH